MEKAEKNLYLVQGIIAYIGNKRRLLSLIGDAMRQAAGPNLKGLRFTDLFSGSGIVSRYARTLGMRVTANDWEPYARVLARAWLEPVSGDISRLFGSPGGLEKAVGLMNSLPDPEEESQYLARYFAPSSMNPDEGDYRTERLFYTRENALRLDAARNYLETDSSTLPAAGTTDDDDLRRCLLLAPIIFEAATHVNTSGVFKACHKGFGGHGKDALGRIMAPIEFKPPIIIDAPSGRVFCEDANLLAARGAISDSDIIYLDPPYNQHQYGSNYHLLNTLVRWDRIPEPLDTGPDGRLLRKAGIRSDWSDTRSEYCYRKSAEEAFGGLMDSLEAPLVLVSYSTDGIIPFDRLRARCEDYGRVRLAANPYVTYRGGRQSNRRRDRNLEFVLIVERGLKTRSKDKKEVDRVLINRRLQLLANDLLRPEILRTFGKTDGQIWQLELPGAVIKIKTRHLARIRELPDITSLDDRDAGAFVRLLEDSRCRSRDEELEVLETLWNSHPEDCRDLVKDIPRILRKMAHRKYRDQFMKRLKSLRETGGRHPADFAQISDELDRIEDQARLRFRD